MYTAYLILLGVIFRATKCLYSMNNLFVIFKCLQTSLTHVHGLSLIVYNSTYNSTPLKAKSMTRRLICFSVKKKFSCSGYKRHKKSHSHIFSVSFFSSSGIHQSHHLDRCQVIGINSFLFCAF